MTRTLTTTVAALAAVAWLPPSTGAAAAQETTVQEALEELRRAERPTSAPAKRILRQLDPSACRFHAEDRVPLPGGGFKNTCRFDPAPRTAAELDAFADQVAAVAADATLPGDVRREAKYALMDAASPKSGRGYEGTPYPRAFDLLARLHEARVVHLHTIMLADSVRGLAYVRELLERSEPPALLCRWVQVDGEWHPFVGGFMLPAPLPPECEGHHWRDDHDTPWCRAGGYLFGAIVAEAWARTPGGKRRGAYGPGPVPDGLPEHVEDWHRRCR